MGFEVVRPRHDGDVSGWVYVYWKRVLYTFTNKKTKCSFNVTTRFESSGHERDGADRSSSGRRFKPHRKRRGRSSGVRSARGKRVADAASSRSWQDVRHRNSMKKKKLIKTVNEVNQGNLNKV